jgi:hypothetical protein
LSCPSVIIGGTASPNWPTQQSPRKGSALPSESDLDGRISFRDNDFFFVDVPISLSV